MAALDDQINALERQGANALRDAIMRLALKRFAQFFATPFIGPLASFFIGRVVGKLMIDLIKDGDALTFAWNNRRLAQGEATRFEDLVTKRDQATTEAELEKAEADAIAAFDSTVTIKR